MENGELIIIPSLRINYPLRYVASLSPLVPLKEGQFSQKVLPRVRTNQKALSPLKGDEWNETKCSGTEGVITQLSTLNSKL